MAVQVHLDRRPIRIYKASKTRGIYQSLLGLSIYTIITIHPRTSQPELLLSTYITIVMPFAPSTVRTEPSFTASSSGAGYSASSVSRASASSQATSRADPGSIAALEDRDYEAELIAKWARYDDHDEKQQIVWDFFNLTFGAEELRHLFQESVLVWYAECAYGSDNLKEIIYRFKAFQHMINQMNTHPGFDQWDGMIFKS